MAPAGRYKNVKTAINDFEALAERRRELRDWTEQLLAVLAEARELHQIDDQRARFVADELGILLTQAKALLGATIQ